MQRLMTYLCWASVVAGAALPRITTEVAGLSARLHTRAQDDRTTITDADTGRTFVPGETSTDRTIYNAVALFCAIALAIFLGKPSTTIIGLRSERCMLKRDIRTDTIRKVSERRHSATMSFANTTLPPCWSSLCSSSAWASLSQLRLYRQGKACVLISCATLLP